jgi:hypothetical protein
MKMNLSSKEFERARELEALGIPIDAELMERSQKFTSGLLIDQDPNIPQTTIFDMGRRKTGIIISMFLMNKSEQVIRLAAARLNLPWSNNIRWLEDPRRRAPAKDDYGFPECHYPYIERDTVLNHRFGPSGKLFPGDSLECFLLGTCEERIPEQYCNRALLESTLAIFDGRNNSYALPLKFLVTRDQKPRQRVGAAKGKINSKQVRRTFSLKEVVV